MGNSHKQQFKIVPSYFSLKSCTQIAYLLFQSKKYLTVGLNIQLFKRKTFLNLLETQNYITQCHSIRQTVQTIRLKHTETFCIIIAYEISEDVCVQFQDMPNVLHVYLYCKRLELGKQLQKKCPKIKIICDKEDDFQEMIQKYYMIDSKQKVRPIFSKFYEDKNIVNKRESNLLSFMNIQNKQIAKLDFLRLAEYLYKNQYPRELQQFRQIYPEDFRLQTVIEWYSKNNFYSKLLHPLVKTNDLSEMGYIRLPFHHVFNAIKTLYRTKKQTTKQFYKALNLEKEEIKFLQKNEGQNIQLMCFLQASENKLEIEHIKEKNILIKIKITREMQNPDYDYGYAKFLINNESNYENITVFNPLNIFFVEKVEEKIVNRKLVKKITLSYGEGTQRSIKQSFITQIPQKQTLQKLEPVQIKIQKKGLLQDLYILRKLNQIQKDNYLYDEYIWTDPSINHIEHEYIIQQFAQSYLIKYYKQIQQVLSIAKNKSNKRYVIISSSLDEKIYKQFQNIKNIVRVHIFCQDIKRAELIKSKYSKINIIHNQLKQFLKKLQIEFRKSNDKIAPRFIDFSENSNFTQLRFNMHSLILMKNRVQAKQDFLKLLNHAYNYEQKQIKKISKEYDIDLKAQAIMYWYSSQNLFYKSVNAISKIENLCQMAYLRLPFTDIFKAIKKLHFKQQQFQQFEAYKGCFLEQSVITFFRSNQNKIIQSLGFISATKSKKIADLTKINAYFIIQVKDQITTSQYNYGYADISKFSKFQDEQQIVFNSFNTYRVQTFQIKNGIAYITLKFNDLLTLQSRLKNDYGITQLEEAEISNFKKQNYKIKQNIITQGDIHFHFKRYQESIQYNKRFLQALKQKGIQQNSEIPRMYNQIAMAYKNIHQLDKAQYYFNKSIKAYFNRFGSNHPYSAAVYINIGQIYREKNQVQKSLECYNKALKIYTLKPNENELETALCYNNLAYAYNLKKERDNALFCYRKSNQIYSRILGAKHIDTIQSYFNIGFIYKAKGQLANSIQSFQKCLNNQIQNGNDDSQLVLKCYGNIGLMYLEMEQLKKAQEYLTQSAKITLKLYGEESVEMMNCYDYLAITYKRKNDLHKCLQYSQKALNIKIKNFGQKHVLTMTAYAQISQIYKQKGELNKALEYHLKSLKMDIDSLDDQLSAVNSYSKIGDMYKDKGDLQRALEFYFKCLKISMNSLGENQGEISKAYNNIGIVYKLKKQIQMSEEYLLKGLKIRLNTFGQKHISTMESYNNVGSLYYDKKDLVSALQYFIKGYKVRAQLKEENQEQIAKALSNIALIYKEKKQYDNAIQYYFQSLQKIRQIYSQEHRQTASCYNNIGMVYYEKGQLDQALKYYMKCHSIRTNVLGENHIQTSISYKNISELYRSKKDLNNSLEFSLKSLRIHTSNFGENHLSTAEDYSRIGTIYKEKGQIDKSIQFLQKSLKITVNNLGQNNLSNINLYNSIASSNVEKGNLIQALDYYNKTLKIRSNILGKDHLETANSYANIAEVYCIKKQFEKSIDFYIKALRIRISVLGEKHFNIAQTYKNLSNVHKIKNDYNKSLEYQQKALKIVQHCYGENHHQTASVYSDIAAIYYARSELDKALKQYLKAQKIYESSSKHNQIEVAKLLNNIASVYDSKAEFEKALEYYLKCLKIKISELGQDNLSTAVTYFNLGLLYRDNNKLAKAYEFLYKSYEVRLNLLGESHKDTKTAYTKMKSCENKKV